jgi:hypothetical protein
MTCNNIVFIVDRILPSGKKSPSPVGDVFLPQGILFAFLVYVKRIIDFNVFNKAMINSGEQSADIQDTKPPLN